MKTAFWQASLTASQAGENSQTNGLEHTIESSILTDLILRKTAEEERHCKKHPQTMLEPKRKEQGDQFFKTYRACVLTLRNAPEWPALKSQLDLNLKDLVESTYGDIFPPRVFLAQCNAPRLGSILKR
jgi:hypothetical protein